MCHLVNAVYRNH